MVLFLVPLSPTDFEIIGLYHNGTETVLTLDWEPPILNMSAGPEDILDNYTITLSSASQNLMEVILAPSPPWNVTLQPNIDYDITITSTNCAGHSFPALVIEDIMFGRITSHTILYWLASVCYIDSELLGSCSSSKWVCDQ